MVFSFGADVAVEHYLVVQAGDLDAVVACFWCNNVQVVDVALVHHGWEHAACCFIASN